MRFMNVTTWPVGLALSLGLAWALPTVAADAGAEGKKDAATAETEAKRNLPLAPVQTLCPITGQKVNDALAVEIDGFRILVTDDAAAEVALKDPEGTFKKLASLKQVATPVSAACPIMGNRVNPDIYVEKDGRRVYVCCKGCVGKVKKEWDKTLKQLKKQAEEGDPEDLPAM